MLSTYKYRQETKLTQMQSTDIHSTYKYQQETKLTQMQSTAMHSTYKYRQETKLTQFLRVFLPTFTFSDAVNCHA